MLGDCDTRILRTGPEADGTLHVFVRIRGGFPSFSSPAFGARLSTLTRSQA
jgi:hypothetical protein